MFRYPVSLLRGSSFLGKSRCRDSDPDSSLFISTCKAGTQSSRVLSFDLQARKECHSMARFSTFANCCLSFRFCLAVALVVYAVLQKPSAAYTASIPTRVVIGFPSPTPRVAPLWIAQDMDFFGKYGLTAQVVLVRNNQMLTAGLGSGDIDIGYTGGTTVLGAAAAGVELKMLANFVSRGKGYLLVRPEIKKPADLAGKRMGVQSSGGTLWMYVMLTLEQLGLDTARDRIQFTCS